MNNKSNYYKMNGGETMKSINKNKSILSDVKVEELEKRDEFLTVLGVTLCCYKMSCCWKV